MFGGSWTSGTRFEIGGRDLRYAKIALRSSSVAMPIQFQGIGGLISREVPMCLPVRIAFMNISSVQIPSPVFWSGVRFAEYEMPQGPANAVFVRVPDHAQGPEGGGGGGSCMPEGWPEKSRATSGSGPFAPIFIGVWQSLHDMIATRYLPRAATLADAGLAGAGFAA
jgi:hypothetical protein